MSVTVASSKVEYTAFMLITALPTWLRLSREERRGVADATLGAALRHHPEITMRFFDAEAFCARCSDIVQFTTADLAGYYLLVEELRDSSLFTEPYFRLDELILAIEDGHQDAG